MNAITDFQISKVDQHNQHLGNFSQMDCQNPTNQPSQNETWFDATLVYRLNECNRRSYF